MTDDDVIRLVAGIERIAETLSGKDRYGASVFENTLNSSGYNTSTVLARIDESLDKVVTTLDEGVAQINFQNRRDPLELIGANMTDAYRRQLNDEVNAKLREAQQKIDEGAISAEVNFTISLGDVT